MHKQSTSAAIIVLLVTGFAFSATYHFDVNVNNVTGPFNHYWENCVGAGHAGLHLRSDMQSQLKKAHDELGFKRVRFHGLFVDDMSVVLPGDNGTLRYSFFNIDRVFDSLLSIGMTPLVEIGFMPKLMASGNQTWAHFDANVTPPKSYDQWTDLIQSFARHLIDRYTLAEVRSWNFEVWNEPNCCPHNFWTGSMEDYFYLYGVTAKALKSVDSQLKVGGPATAMSAFVDEFIAYCREHSLPYDFISTHEYPTDPPGPETRTFFINKLKQTRKSAGNVPVYYTEYDDGYNSADSYGAAFVIYQNYMAHGVVDILSWWVFSDIFEEGGMYPDPYNAKWMPVDGLTNVYGIPKPSYRAFQLLHWSGNQLVDTYPNTWNRDDTSVSVFATIGNNTSIFIVNWNVMKVPTDAAHVSVTVHGVPKKQISAKIYRIDKENTTSFPSWEKMGSPMYLKPQQVKDLNTASELVAVPLTITQVGDTVSFEVDIMAYSVINVVLE